MDNNLSLYDVIDSHIKKFEDNLYTALPAKVVAYKEDKQFVDVEPSFSVFMKETVKLPYPRINDVPLMFPSSGGALLSFPVNVGDTVLLLFSKYRIDEWKAGEGQKVDIIKGAQHTINNAVAIAGLYTEKSHLSPNPDDVELKFNDNKIVLKKDGSVEIVTDSSLKVTNSSEELISLLIDTLNTISEATVNTTYGVSPLNNKAQIQALITRLESFEA